MFKNLKSLVSYSYDLYVTGISTRMCCTMNTVGYHYDFFTPNLHKDDPFAKLAFNRVVIEHYNTLKSSAIWGNDKDKPTTKSWKIESPIDESYIHGEYVWRQTLYCEEILCHAILTSEISNNKAREGKAIYEMIEFWYKDIFITIKPSDGIGTLTIAKADNIRKYQRDQLKAGNEKYTQLSIFETLLSTAISYYESFNTEALLSMGIDSLQSSFPDIFKTLHDILEEGKMLNDTVSSTSNYGMITVAGVTLPFHFNCNTNGFCMFEIIWDGYYFRIKSWKAGMKIVPIDRLENNEIIYTLESIKHNLEQKFI